MKTYTLYEHLSSQSPWILLLLAIGFSKLLELSVIVLKWFYVYFVRPAKDLKKYGSWALVTGSTDGIGKAFAFQLAHRGLDLVLVGRNPEKLKDVSDSIIALYPHTQVKTVVVDFSGDLDEGMRRIGEAIEGLDVGVLVNNAGVSNFPKYFHEVDGEFWSNVIKVNLEGTTRVTEVVLPGMLRRKSGAIVNIGSGTFKALPSSPLLAVYSATKAYIDQFSRCLHVEYKNKGIDVQCQVPLYVATKMTSFRKSTLFIPSPNAYAEAALRWIGHEVRCTPYWPHSIQWSLLHCLPESAIDTWRLGVCLGIRKRYLLREQEKEELKRKQASIEQENNLIRNLKAN